jgi:hypothetical protein
MATEHWPGWEHDQRIADYWTPRIHAALTAAVPTRELAEAHRGGGIEGARTLVRAHLTPMAREPLADVLAELAAVGMVYGAMVGLAQVADAGRQNPAPPAALTTALHLAETRGWIGSALAAALDPVTLSAIRTDADLAAAQILQSLADRIAAVLAAGWLAAATVMEIIRDLKALLAPPSRASRIAVTETDRAMIAVSIIIYGQHGFQLWDWIAGPSSCPRCIALAAGGPYTIGAPHPPEHPNCGCGVAPAGRSRSILTGVAGLPVIQSLIGIG